MKSLLVGLFLASGCAGITPINDMPGIVLGEPSFYPTISAHTDASIISGNRVELLFNGDQIFPALLKAIRGAEKSVTYAQYFYDDGAIAREMAEAFAERCRAGVQVKILIDALGGGALSQDMQTLWKQSGCQLEWFQRVKANQFVTPWELLDYNHRSHRRILVVDGKIGFTGGHGVSDAWTGDGRTRDHWRQTDVRVEGPIVQQLQAAFVDSWRRTTGNVLGDDAYFPALHAQGTAYAQIVKSSPLGGSFGSYLLFLLSITSAQKSIHIANPYFFPDDRIEQALINAAKRGVKVVVLTPAKSDHATTSSASHSGFGSFLLGGVEIYEYQPALMHTKAMVVDGVWATVGSANLDYRSLAINEELNLVVYGATFAQQVEKSFQDDLKYSKRLTYEAWNSRPLWDKIMEVFTIPIKPQL
ncbi:MAG TPA: phospholipase D-like domain-containing protein [Candidatus Binatia bacterium]